MAIWANLAHELVKHSRLAYELGKHGSFAYESGKHGSLAYELGKPWHAVCILAHELGAERDWVESFRIEPPFLFD